MGSPGSGCAQEHHVVFGGDEVQRPKVGDGVAFEVADMIKVELLQRFPRRRPSSSNPWLVPVGLRKHGDIGDEVVQQPVSVVVVGGRRTVSAISRLPERGQVGGGEKPESAGDRRDRATHRVWLPVGEVHRRHRPYWPPVRARSADHVHESLPASVPSKSTGFSCECPICRKADPPLLVLARPASPTSRATCKRRRRRGW